MMKIREKMKNKVPDECDPFVFFSKMAPRKVKTQGKRNNIKIKSKVNTQKRGKPIKKPKKGEKPVDNLKWLNKLAVNEPVKKSENVPEWLNGGAYKHKMLPRASETNFSEFQGYSPPGPVEDKSTVSDNSEECKCSTSKYENRGGILKRKTSSCNSLVTNYIKSGMDQVASFIVESAIRFGEQHGVVIPDKNTPNVYEITTPEKKFEEKFRKIRFKIPDRALAYEDAKKLMWRSRDENSENPKRRAQTPMPSDWKGNHPANSSSWDSAPDSLEEILPILEKLKEEGNIVTSDLDLDKLNESDKEDPRDRGRDRESKRDRERERDRERLREKLRSRGKRYKSLDGGSEKGSEEMEYRPEDPRWKKFRRDSLELGRRRMRAVSGPRKQENMTPPPY